MRILLDTHVWLWMIAAPERLSREALASLSRRRDELYLSAASCWEIAVKHAIGKLPLPSPPEEFVPQRLIRDGIRPLSVEHQHALAVAALPDHHRDPFDRLLVVQAILEDMTIYTADEKLLAYRAKCVMV
jgi:PIN domain nuclease of toxin-antitoxin system